MDEESLVRYTCRNEKIVAVIPAGMLGNNMPIERPVYRECGHSFIGPVGGPPPESDKPRSDKRRQEAAAAREERRSRLMHQLVGISNPQERLLRGLGLADELALVAEVSGQRMLDSRGIPLPEATDLFTFFAGRAQQLGLPTEQLDGTVGWLVRHPTDASTWALVRVDGGVRFFDDDSSRRALPLWVLAGMAKLLGLHD